MSEGAPSAVSDSDILTLDEAAALFRVTRITLSRLIRAGRVPALNTGTGKHARWRLSRAECLRALATLATPVTPPPSVDTSPSTPTPPTAREAEVNHRVVVRGGEEGRESEECEERVHRVNQPF